MPVSDTILFKIWKRGKRHPVAKPGFLLLSAPKSFARHLWVARFSALGDPTLFAGFFGKLKRCSRQRVLNQLVTAPCRKSRRFTATLAAF